MRLRRAHWLQGNLSDSSQQQIDDRELFEIDGYSLAGTILLTRRRAAARNFAFTAEETC